MHHRRVLETPVKIDHVIAGAEDERDVPVLQDLRQGIDAPPVQVDVQDRGDEVLRLIDHPHTLIEGGCRSQHGPSEVGQARVELERNQGLVLHDQDPRIDRSGVNLARSEGPLPRLQWLASARAPIQEESRGRQEQGDVHAFSRPLHVQLPIELALDDLAQQYGAESARRRDLDRRAAALSPVELQTALGPDAPGQLDDPVFMLQRSILAGIGREFMQHQADRLDGGRAKDHGRSIHPALPGLDIGGQFAFDRGGEFGPLPAAVRQQRVRARQGRDAPLNGLCEAFLGVRAGQADQRPGDCQRVLGAMVHFPGEQVPGVLGGAPLTDVPQDHRRQMLAAHLDMRNRRLDREFLAIGPEAADGAEGAHLAVGHARLGEVPDVVVVRRAQPLGHEHGERLVDSLFAGQPEHPLGGGVEQDDAVALIDRDDRIHGGIDDALKPASGSAKLLVEDRRPLGDVAQDDRRQPLGSY